MICGEEGRDLQSLNFNFWEFSHYMTALVLAERDRLLSCCEAQKSQAQHSSMAPPSQNRYQGLNCSLRPQCFYTDCTRFIGIKTDFFFLEYLNSGETSPALL